MGGNPNAVKGATGKAEAAKLQDAGISPKQWPKKMSGRKRVAYPTRRKSLRWADHVNMRDEKTVANVLMRMLPFGRAAQKRARVNIASLGLGNQRHVARSQHAAGVGRLATTAATDAQALPTIRFGTRPSLWAGYSSLKVIVNELSRFSGYITFNL
jgi:hypothetical protein